MKINVIRVYFPNDAVKIHSGITHGKVLNGEDYAHRIQKLIYVHLLIELLPKVSVHSPEQT